MSVINWKFTGFIAVLIALVFLAIWGGDTKIVQMVIGSLGTTLAYMGRDLYRSTTSNKDESNGNIKVG